MHVVRQDDKRIQNHLEPRGFTLFPVVGHDWTSRIQEPPAGFTQTRPTDASNGVRTPYPSTTPTSSSLNPYNRYTI